MKPVKHMPRYALIQVALNLVTPSFVAQRDSGEAKIVNHRHPKTLRKHRS